jgi:cytochrome c551/c552
MRSVRRHYFRIILALVTFSACNSATVANPSTATPAYGFRPNSPEARGFALFSGKGRCASCHSLSANTVIVGPSLAGIASRAGSPSDRNNATADVTSEEQQSIATWRC